jgi:hypothetical protein
MPIFVIGTKPSEEIDDWGFYAHKLINRMAVFTLPDDLIEFYKANIEYITSHAVDPDKRRYAVKGEAIRHYIDLDHWKVEGSIQVPHDFSAALLKFNQFYWIHNEKRILLFDTLIPFNADQDSLIFTNQIINELSIKSNGIPKKEMRSVFLKSAMPYYDEELWKIPAAPFKVVLPFLRDEDFIEIVDRFSPHGILPFHLEKTYYQLVDAFKNKSVDRILKLSADIGHYVGDAHVPLHTTQNYNGQLTNQDGIHAFWESRIPELFAENEFDFVVGAASYIANIKSFIWQIVEESHSGVDLVLSMEKSLSQNTPADQQYCHDERLGVITKIQCKDYSKKYHQLLDNQVENRMRESILNLGSIWMSAWVEAGQPQLSLESKNIPLEESIKADSTLGKSQRFQIREHE